MRQLMSLCISLIIATSALADESSSTSISAVTPPPVKHWGLDANLNNSVGIGTFTKGYAHSPNWVTYLTLTPSYTVQQSDYWPKTKIAAVIAPMGNWLVSSSSSYSDIAYPVQMSLDIPLTAQLPKVLHWQDTGLSISPKAGVLIPVTLGSIAIGRVLGATASLPLSFSKSSFSASLSPTVNAWTYSQDAKTVPCADSGSIGSLFPPMVNPNQPEFDLGNRSLGSASNTGFNDAGGGRCYISGRQTLASVITALSLGYSPGKHNVSAALVWFVNFLRPLEPSPDSGGPNTSGQAFTEATLGDLSYSYTWSTFTDLTFTGGVLSYQSSFTKDGKLAFPFFDFITPNKNQTQFYVSVSTSI